jgi:hypothetical protein
MRHSFPRFSFALAVTLLLVGSLLPLSTGSANASDYQMITSCGSGYYTPNACKYDQAKYSVSGDCGSGSGCTISTVYWRGGTASGSCDPSNDIDSWHLQFVKIIKVSDGTVRWSYGPGNNHTNCNVTATTYSRSPSLKANSDQKIDYKWCFTSSNSSHSFCDQGYFYVAVR